MKLQAVLFDLEDTLHDKSATLRAVWPVMEELPAVIPHVETSSRSGEGEMEVTFASGSRDEVTAFREEIRISLGRDGGLKFAHSWGLPHGDFKERSRCDMVPDET